MRVNQEDDGTWYEGNGRKACVSRNGRGYMVHAMWTRGGVNWIGGYGEGTARALSLQEAQSLAERFISGQPVPEELGGYEDNKPEVTHA